MKLPLALTFIILAAGSYWGVHESQVLTTLREKHRQVTREATALGVSTDASKPDTQTKVTKRQREDSSRKVKDFTNTLVAFAKEMKEMEKSSSSLFSQLHLTCVQGYTERFAIANQQNSC